MNKNKLHKLLKSILLISTITFSSAGMADATTAIDARGSKVVVSDQTLEHSVNQVLSAQLPNGSFTVASYDHNVLLAGQVPTAEDKTKAEPGCPARYALLDR